MNLFDVFARFALGIMLIPAIFVVARAEPNYLGFDNALGAYGLLGVQLIILRPLIVASVRMFFPKSQ